MENGVIITKELTKFYGKIRGIEDINISIPSGGVGLLGPNGAGKTTLIRTLLGIVKPTKGTAHVLGYDIRHEIHQIRDLIGYIPEYNTSFMPDSTAMKFVAFCGRINGLSHAASKQRASDSLYYVGLGEERYRQLSTFSLGMKQKVKLAIALVHDPEIIICDEPTNGLDPTGRVQMLDLIRDLQKDQHKNIILSSHLLRDVEQTTDYALIVSQGVIKTEGRIKDLTSNRRSTISIKVKENINEFLNSLKNKNIDAWIEGDYIEVKKDKDIELEIFRAAKQNKTVIRYLGSRSSTLEDVFIHLVNNKEDLIQ